MKRRYFGGNSGYVGYSKSYLAIAAEERGLRNKSQMNGCFVDKVNEILRKGNFQKVTLKQVKEALPHITADEWHHTSSYGNRTNYYSPKTIAEYFMAASEERQTTKALRDELFKKLNQEMYYAIPKDDYGYFHSTNGYSVHVSRTVYDKEKLDIAHDWIGKGDYHMMMSGEELEYDKPEEYNVLQSELNKAFEEAREQIHSIYSEEVRKFEELKRN